MDQNKETEFERAVRLGELVHPEKFLQYHIDNFNKGGGEKPVKVMPAGVDQEQVSGFFTQEKCIQGKTPQQMEDVLGLNVGDLKNGATIYALSSIPTADQFVPAGYTHMPGGRFYEEGQKYPLGPGVIQFRLNEPVPAKVVAKVGYDEPWKAPSAEQTSIDQGKLGKTAGGVAGSVAAGPVGGEAGKIAGETAGRAQAEALKSTGQTTENPIVTDHRNGEDNSAAETDEEQQYGYGY